MEAAFNARVDPLLPSGTCVTLHLYLPSGEFLAEAIELTSGSTCRFVDALETGMITPELDTAYRFGDHRFEYSYVLVYNGIELLNGTMWDELVRDHGLSLEEPNDIIIVATEVDWDFFLRRKARITMRAQPSLLPSIAAGARIIFPDLLTRASVSRVH